MESSIQRPRRGMPTRGDLFSIANTVLTVVMVHELLEALWLPPNAELMRRIALLASLCPFYLTLRSMFGEVPGSGPVGMRGPCASPQSDLARSSMRRYTWRMLAAIGLACLGLLVHQLLLGACVVDPPPGHDEHPVAVVAGSSPTDRPHASGRIGHHLHQGISSSAILIPVLHPESLEELMSEPRSLARGVLETAFHEPEEFRIAASSSLGLLALTRMAFLVATLAMTIGLSTATVTANQALIEFDRSKAADHAPAGDVDGGLLSFRRVVRWLGGAGLSVVFFLVVQGWSAAQRVFEFARVIELPDSIAEVVGCMELILAATLVQYMPILMADASDSRRSGDRPDAEPGHGARGTNRNMWKAIIGAAIAFLAAVGYLALEDRCIREGRSVEGEPTRLLLPIVLPAVVRDELVIYGRPLVSTPVSTASEPTATQGPVPPPEAIVASRNPVATPERVGEPAGESPSLTIPVAPVRDGQRMQELRGLARMLATDADRLSDRSRYFEPYWLAITITLFALLVLLMDVASIAAFMLLGEVATGLQKPAVDACVSAASERLAEIFDHRPESQSRTP